MHCPFCVAQDTKVIDSRLGADGYQVRRRRECLECKSRFTTFETAELMLPKIIKSNGYREPFNEKKIRVGIEKALEKRNVSQERIDDAIRRIVHKLQVTGEREVPSSFLGSLVIEELKELDKIAYIRFVSVYKSFDDLKEFGKEIAKLQDKSKL